jgi:hypothetical protein
MLARARLVVHEARAQLAALADAPLFGFSYQYRLRPTSSA